MSMYTEHTKTSHNVNNKESIWETYKNWVIPNFKNGDCFVTLTFQPYVRLDEVECSRDVKCFLNRLNRTIYGKAADNTRKHKSRKSLKCIPVFEENSSQGVHVHMLLGQPDDKSRFDGDFKKLVIDTWYKLGRAGNKKAQDVQASYDIVGVLGYMNKHIKLGDRYLNLDVNNIHLGIQG